jgi:hypothetical protein
MKHKHYWYTSQSVWQGTKPSDSMLARYCACGEIQMAQVNKWRKANLNTQVYPDVIEECRKGIDGIRKESV